jgi:hypothetical protein
MALLGMLKRKESIVLTYRGWLLFSIIAICLFYLVFNNVYSFLAVTDIVKADILVVEGYLPEHALKEVFKDYQRGDYSLLITIGGELESGHLISKHRNYAEFAASIFKRYGINVDAMKAVPANSAVKDNLYAPAISLKRWIKQSGLSIKAVNICSLALSARKARLIIQRTLGGKIKVGIISYESHAYGPENWWKSSIGLKTIIDEIVEYLYTLFFFRGEE